VKKNLFLIRFYKRFNITKLFSDTDFPSVYQNTIMKLSTLMLCLIASTSSAYAQLSLSDILAEQTNLTKSNYDLNFRGEEEVFVTDSIYCHTFDFESMQVVPNTRSYNLEFNDNGNVLEEEEQVYRLDINAWQNSSKKSYEYDEDFFINNQLEKTWDASLQTWVEDRRLAFVWENESIVSSVTETWDVASGAFIPSNRQSYTFNANGDNTAFVDEQWDEANGTWVNNIQVQFAVNAAGEVLNSIFQTWSPTLGWQNGNLTTNIYDTNSNQIEAVIQLWDGLTNQWNNSGKTLYEYDAANNRTSTTNQFWNVVSAEWSNNNRVVETYNSDNLPLTSTVQNWNGDMFTDGFRTLREYNNELNLQGFENQIFQDDSWNYLNNCEFYWRSVIIDGVKESVDNLDCRIQNPIDKGGIFQCESLITNEAKQYFLFDLNGRIVDTQNIENQSFIQIKDNLSFGSYILVISNAKGIIHREKLIVR